MRLDPCGGVPKHWAEYDELEKRIYQRRLNLALFMADLGIRHIQDKHTHHVGDREVFSKQWVELQKTLAPMTFMAKDMPRLRYLRQTAAEWDRMQEISLKKNRPA